MDHRMADAGACRFKIESTAGRVSCSILFLSYLSLVRLSRGGRDHNSTVFLSVFDHFIVRRDFVGDRCDLWFFSSFDHSSLLFLHLFSKVEQIWRWIQIWNLFLLQIIQLANSSTDRSLSFILWKKTKSIEKFSIGLAFVRSWSVIHRYFIVHNSSFSSAIDLYVLCCVHFGKKKE